MRLRSIAILMIRIQGMWMAWNAILELTMVRVYADLAVRESASSGSSLWDHYHFQLWMLCLRIAFNLGGSVFFFKQQGFLADLFTEGIDDVPDAAEGGGNAGDLGGNPGS